VQYGGMLEQYNAMADDILRTAAEEAGREYTPGATAATSSAPKNRIERIK